MLTQGQTGDQVANPNGVLEILSTSQPGSGNTQNLWRIIANGDDAGNLAIQHFNGLNWTTILVCEAEGEINYLVANQSPRFSFWPAFTSASGTDTFCSNGDRYWSHIYIPYNATITGIQYLIGSVGGTDKVIVELHDNAGVLLATSALAGTTVGTNGTMQSVAFTAPIAIKGPAMFYVAVQFNGATAKFKTVPAATLGLATTLITGTSAGTFGTSANITPGSSFVADKGPIVATY